MLYKVAFAERNSLNASYVMLQIKYINLKENEVVMEAAECWYLWSTQEHSENQSYEVVVRKDTLSLWVKY